MPYKAVASILLIDRYVYMSLYADSSTFVIKMPEVAKYDAVKERVELHKILSEPLIPGRSPRPGLARLSRSSVRVILWPRSWASARAIGTGCSGNPCLARASRHGGVEQGRVLHLTELSSLTSKVLPMICLK